MRKDTSLKKFPMWLWRLTGKKLIKIHDSKCSSRGIERGCMEWGADKPVLLRKDRLEEVVPEMPRRVFVSFHQLSPPQHSDKEIRAVFKQVDASSSCELLKTLILLQILQTSSMLKQPHI